MIFVKCFMCKHKKLCINKMLYFVFFIKRMIILNKFKIKSHLSDNKVGACNEKCIKTFVDVPYIINLWISFDYNDFDVVYERLEFCCRSRNRFVQFFKFY